MLVVLLVTVTLTGPKSVAAKKKVLLLFVMSSALLTCITDVGYYYIYLFCVIFCRVLVGESIGLCVYEWEGGVGAK